MNKISFLFFLILQDMTTRSNLVTDGYELKRPYSNKLAWDKTLTLKWYGGEKPESIEEIDSSTFSEKLLALFKKKHFTQSVNPNKDNGWLKEDVYPTDYELVQFASLVYEANVGYKILKTAANLSINETERDIKLNNINETEQDKFQEIKHLTAWKLKHQILALYQLFTKEQREELLSKKIITQMLFLDKPEFVHRTFSEYFVSEFIAYRLKNNDEIYPQQNKDGVWKFLLNEILIREEHRIIRVFFDYQLAKDVDLKEMRAHSKQDLFVQNLLLNMIDNENGATTSLHIAAQDGLKETIQFLLNNVYQQNMWLTLLSARDEKRNTALHLAAQAGHLDIVNFLIEKGAVVDARNQNRNTALHLAAQAGHLDVVNFLIEKGAVVDARNQGSSTALHLAAKAGHSNVVSLLIDNRANVEVRDNSDWTPLFNAASSGHLEVVKLLVEKGNANVNYKAKRYGGITVLHRAANPHRWHIIRWLVENGKADVTIRDNNGDTVLHTIAQSGTNSGWEEIKWLVDWLIKEGKWKKKEITDYINAPDEYRQTVLSYAVNSGWNRLDVAHWLVDKGADVNSLTNNQRKRLLL